MASKTPRDERTQRWRGIPILMAVTFAASTLQLVWASASMAQVKAPSKNQLRAPEKTASTDNVQPFSISSDGLVVEQLISLRIDPADAAAAGDAVSKALGKLDAKVTSSGRAILQSQGANMPKRLVALQLFSAEALAVELERASDGTFGFKVAPGATENDDQRVSTVPSATSAAGPGARSIVPGSITVATVSSATLVSSLAPAGASAATLKELTQALAGFAPASAKVEVLHGRTVDGTPASCSPASPTGRASSLSGGSRLRTNPKAGSTKKGVDWVALLWPIRGRVRASPRRSAPGATMGARAVAASTTASISRARPAIRSSRRRTA